MLRGCRRVQAAIAEGHQPGTGSVRQALCGALYEEVTDFYRLIAVLEGQLHVLPPMPGEEYWAAWGYVGVSMQNCSRHAGRQAAEQQ